MEITKLKDPFTGELFTPRRSNQRFANRTNQIRFNNEKQKKYRKENVFVNRILELNKKVLKAKLGSENAVVRSKDFLLGAGYRFEFFSYRVKDERFTAYCCYDYCITDMENGTYKIFKNVTTN